MEQYSIPVLLLTGYLGSGKTTLVNNILNNRKGLRFAVIVNDLGEVNIDADLIQQGGVVGQKDESLVALQNGCICCTLKMDLIEQLSEIIAQHKFDYIVIEASGICEPEPIAQTICSMPTLEEKYTRHGLPRLDCVVTVVDALRMQNDFGGKDLVKGKFEEDDLENLIIQQIEFCNIVLINKASEVPEQELGRIRQLVHTLNPKARILTCDYGNVEFDQILHTHMFDFEKTATSATWVRVVEDIHDEDDDDLHIHHHHHDDDDDDDHEEHHHHHDHDDDDEHDGHHHHEEEHEHHGHHHHHHHDHDEGEAEEYGISTFVYHSRKPFYLRRFDEFVSRLPKNVIRAKGVCYFREEYDVCYVFDQVGKQVSLRDAGQWYASMPPEDLQQFMIANPQILNDWDDLYGDRMQKLEFIGQKMDRDELIRQLDECIVK
ncbi:MAG: GTP-binding protein [Bacteroidales bacterium]|nr:GTP-binding protein [Bacteroidales bacterium]